MLQDGFDQRRLRNSAIVKGRLLGEDIDGKHFVICGHVEVRFEDRSLRVDISLFHVNLLIYLTNIQEGRSRGSYNIAAYNLLHV